MDFSWQLLKTLFYLSFIIILFFIIIKFIKNQSNLQGLNQNLRVLERLHFNSNQFLCLTKVINELWILGVSEGQIELLAKIDDPEEVEEITDKVVNGKGMNWQEGFMNWFNRDEDNHV